MEDTVVELEDVLRAPLKKRAWIEIPFFVGLPIPTALPDPKEVFK